MSRFLLCLPRLLASSIRRIRPQHQQGMRPAFRPNKLRILWICILTTLIQHPNPPVYLRSRFLSCPRNRLTTKNSITGWLALPAPKPLLTSFLNFLAPQPCIICAPLFVVKPVSARVSRRSNAISDHIIS